MSEVGPRLSILVVDDEESVRDAVCAALDVIGKFTITVAPDGITGLKLLESTRPDILLVDLVMGDMDGTQVLRAIRTTPGAHRPACIVLMTAYPDPFPHDKLRDLGADALLEKPFHLSELSEALGLGRAELVY
jgi:CheY-like chemotaxis protein